MPALQQPQLLLPRRMQHVPPEQGVEREDAEHLQHTACSQSKESEKPIVIITRKRQPEYDERLQRPRRPRASVFQHLPDAKRWTSTEPTNPHDSNFRRPKHLRWLVKKYVDKQ